MPPKKNLAVYQLKVTLRYSAPPIWRRIQVWEDSTLARLHEVLQVAMGWEDCHLHEFHIGKRMFGPPGENGLFEDRDVSDERKARLHDVLPRVGTKLDYWYDFGDSWHHDIQLESISVPETGAQVPRCIAGERRCPPEDVGGIPGYERYLEILADAKHEEHREMKGWRGAFDPEPFSVVQVNREMATAFRPRKIRWVPKNDPD